MRHTRHSPPLFTAPILVVVVYAANLAASLAGMIATTTIAADALAGSLVGIAIGSYYATRR